MGPGRSGIPPTWNADPCLLATRCNWRARDLQPPSAAAPLALPHALRTLNAAKVASNLKEVQATCSEGASELDAALHLLHPPDKDLEVEESTVFVESVWETPPLVLLDPTRLGPDKTDHPVHDRL